MEAGKLEGRCGYAGVKLSPNSIMMRPIKKGQKKNGRLISLRCNYMVT